MNTFILFNDKGKIYSIIDTSDATLEINSELNSIGINKHPQKKLFEELKKNPSKLYEYTINKKKELVKKVLKQNDVYKE